MMARDGLATLAASLVARYGRAGAIDWLRAKVRADRDGAWGKVIALIEETPA